MTQPFTLVLGGGGLLGKAVRAVASRRSGGRVIDKRVRWSEPDHVTADLEAGLDRLISLADGGTWRVAWCAGVGVTSTARDDLEREVDVLRGFMTAVVDRARSSASDGKAAVFLASSAGGVYSGSSGPPFTEHTEARPLAPYGEAKLAAEGVVRDICGAGGVPALIGRIGNLYGPGQNLLKPQGLITHLCRSHVTGQPTSIYVSLDTLRDYIYVQDCAEMVVDGFERLEKYRAEEPGSGSVVTKIIASQRSLSVGALLMESRRVFRRPLRILVASSPYSKAQVRDLRLRSVVWPELDRRSLTPLPVGISATIADLEQRMGGAHR